MNFGPFGLFWEKCGSKSIATMENGNIIKLTLLGLLYKWTETCIGIFSITNIFSQIPYLTPTPKTHIYILQRLTVIILFWYR